MKTKEFNKIKSYCYVLIKKSTKQKYYGVRARNVRENLSPLNDFGKRYFSSGCFKEEFKEHPGKFKFILRWTFNSSEEAEKYEKKIVQILIRKNQWYNWVNKGYFPFLVHNEESLKKLKKSLKKSWNIERRKQRSKLAREYFSIYSNRLAHAQAVKKTKNKIENKKLYSFNSKKLWKNNEYREKVCLKMKKAWECKKKRANLSKIAKQRYKNVLYLKKIKESLKNSWNKERKVKASLKQKEVWSNSFLKSKQKKIQKKIWNNKKNKQHSKLMKKLFSNSKHRKKMKIININTWRRASELTRKKHSLACKEAWKKRRLKMKGGKYNG